MTQNGSAPLSSRPAALLRPGRLDPLARRIAGLLRKAFLSSEEAAYTWRRARTLAGIRGRPAKPRRLPAVLTVAELRAILTEAYRAEPRDGLLIRLAFESAVRVAELARFDVPDVDFAERTLFVRQGKGARDRLVLMTGDLAQLLQVHLDGRTRGALFVSNRGTRISIRRIQAVVHAAARRAGVQKKISPHSLRHAFATLARNAGMPADSVQAILGHASPRSTQIYSQLAMATVRRDYDTAMRAIAGAGLEGAALAPLPGAAP